MIIVATESDLICPREHTVSELAATLDEVNIVHIRGTPASGKTRLSELLRDHYSRGKKGFLDHRLGKTQSHGSLGQFCRAYQKLGLRTTRFSNH